LRIREIRVNPQIRDSKSAQIRESAIHFSKLHIKLTIRKTFFSFVVVAALTRLLMNASLNLLREYEKR